jgi:pyruvate kinase
MLAGETAAGAYPVRAVQTLDAVIRDAESIAPTSHVLPIGDTMGSRHVPALSEAAVTLSTAAQANAIVAVTVEGKTARLLSALRPAAPILAATPDASVAATLALWWGVMPFVTAERAVDAVAAQLLERGLIVPGALVVFINVSPDQTRGDANFLHVRHLGSA